MDIRTRRAPAPDRRGPGSVMLKIWPLLAMLLTGCQSFVTGGMPPFEFALLGDNPYVEFNESKYERMIDEINRRRELRWVVHLGDIKGGSQTCDEQLLRSRFEVNQRFEHALIFTPGDNDWFDCSRPAAGAYDPGERLGYLRRLFYPEPGVTLGRRVFPVRTQADDPAWSDFVENVQWTHGGVIFATLHIVGISASAPGSEILDTLLAAGLDWLEDVFARAKAEDARGVFLAFHVDPWLLSGPLDMLQTVCPVCPVRPGYDALHEALVRHAASFDKPILVATGDTHVYRVDKPLYDLETKKLVEHFTRVEPFGHPYVHWVRIRVNPGSNELFEIHQEWVEGNFGQPD